MGEETTRLFKPTAGVRPVKPKVMVATPNLGHIHIKNAENPGWCLTIGRGTPAGRTSSNPVTTRCSSWTPTRSFRTTGKACTG